MKSEYPGHFAAFAGCIWALCIVLRGVGLVDWSWWAVLSPLVVAGGLLIVMLVLLISLKGEP